MNTKVKNKVSLIVYDEKESPKYLEISRTGLKFIFFGLPALSIVCLVLLLGMTIYFKQIKTMAERKEPTEILRLKNLNAELTAEKAALATSQEELLLRLGATSVSTGGAMGIPLFKIAQGANDLSTSPVINIETPVAEIVQEGIKFNFNLVNLTKDNARLAGHIFVLMKLGDSLSVYPPSAMNTEEFGISYNLGEAFATSRFRPVEIVFEKPTTKKVNDALFKILIFSRTGDLLHKKTIVQKLVQ
jgi:hypothetical protein